MNVNTEMHKCVTACEILQELRYCCTRTISSGLIYYMSCCCKLPVACVLRKLCKCLSGDIVLWPVIKDDIFSKLFMCIRLDGEKTILAAFHLPSQDNCPICL